MRHKVRVLDLSRVNVALQLAASTNTTAPSRTFLARNPSGRVFSFAAENLWGRGDEI